MSEPTTITVERRSDDFMAFLNGNRSLWGCGRTEAIAVLDVLRAHAVDAGVTVHIPTFTETTRNPGNPAL